MARSSSRQGNLAMRIRDELGEVYADVRFASAFGVRGRPGISPGQLMMASVLQFSENLTDRQAAEAVRDRMTWKYALGLVRAGGRQRTDSTHVLGAIRALNRLELAGRRDRPVLTGSRCTAPGSMTCTCPKARPPDRT
jgi:hypothetical protein